MANDLTILTECLRALQDDGDPNALRRAVDAVAGAELVPMPEFLSCSGGVPAAGTVVLRMRVHGPDWESQIAAMRAAQADRERVVVPAQPAEEAPAEERVRLLEVD
jgi:hypothetical protein